MPQKESSTYQLDFKEPVGMGERVAETTERHGLELQEHCFDYNWP